MTRACLCLAGLLLFLAAPAGCARGAQPKPQRLPTCDIQIAGRTISVEVADSDATRTIGMMHRRKLAPDEGMLFVYPTPQPLRFWMKNTPAPLSIAFLAEDGVVINIAHMQPLTLGRHRSRLPCRFALEMPQGWFAAHNVNEGDRIILPPNLSASP